MDLHNLDTALPFILSRLETHIGEVLEYASMLVRSAVDAELNGVNNDKIVRTFNAIVSQWGDSESQRIIDLIEPIKAAIKEVDAM